MPLDHDTHANPYTYARRREHGGLWCERTLLRHWAVSWHRHPLAIYDHFDDAAEYIRHLLARTHSPEQLPLPFDRDAARSLAHTVTAHPPRR